MKNDGLEGDSIRADDNNITKDSKLYKVLEALNDENIQKLMEEGGGEEPIFSEDHNVKIQQIVGERFGPEAAKKIEEIQKSRKEGRIEKITKKHDTGKSRHFYPRMKNVVAAVLIIVLLLGVTMSTEAFRLPIMNFIMYVQQEFMAVNVVDSGISEESGDARKTIDKIYILGKTIEGYELVSEEINYTYVYREYQNEGQSKYRFFQQGQAGNIHYDTEDTDYEIIETIYNDVMLSESNGIYYLTWFYDGYIFKISGELTVEELVMLAESLMLDKDLQE